MKLSDKLNEDEAWSDHTFYVVPRGERYEIRRQDTARKFGWVSKKAMDEKYNGDFRAAIFNILKTRVKEYSKLLEDAEERLRRAYGGAEFYIRTMIFRWRRILEFCQANIDRYAP